MKLAGGHNPERMCAICRQRFEKAILSRYIINLKGALVEDKEKRLPGRGIYCCSNPRCQARFASYIPGKKSRVADKGKCSQGGIL